MILRPYQIAAADAIEQEWQDHNATLLVLPTGTGKTQVFSEIIRRQKPKRALVLIHRAELAYQAKARIEKIAQVDCEIEMADQRASTTLWSRTPCVIASVQTLYKRLAQFKPQDFDILICDEAHHCVAPTWRSIIDHFRQNEKLRVLGVTATPDRADEAALGQIFESVAYDYEILQAIQDGWLVPVEQQMVTIGNLDFSQMRTTLGDLHLGDLTAVMEAEENAQGMVGASIQIIGDRPSIYFATSVVQAQMAADIFNRYRPEMADIVHGTTDEQKRKDILANFQTGKTQVLCNVGIATEGFDAPAATVVLNGRPTKSRALYAQIAGRVLRPLPGVVDGLESPEERRASIAASPKSAALLVDFVGNSGRHKLMSAADILGGNVSDEAVELATLRAKSAGGPVRMDEELAAAEKEIEERKQRRLAEEARKAKLKADVHFVAEAVNPFDVFGISPVRERGWHTGKQLSEKQRAVLNGAGINPDSIQYAQAQAIIGEIFRRRSTHLCTFKQAKILKKYGYATKDITFTQASATIDAIAKAGWRRPNPVAA